VIASDPMRSLGRTSRDSLCYHFSNLSVDPEREYFANELAEEFIDTISWAPAWRREAWAL